MVRIRKNASKLLGSDYLSYPPLPPLPPLPVHSWGPHFSSTAAEEGGGREGEANLCRLNCSPWDVIGTDLHHLSSCFQEEDGRGIMGNGLKFEEYEEILSTFESLASADEIELKSKDDIDPKKVKKRRRRRRRKEEENASVVEVLVCSKNDGKGWHCKRPAKPQHTLCDHHLGLLRNYSSRTNGVNGGHRESYDDGSETERPKSVTVTEAAGGGGFVKSHRPKVAALETAGDDFYYYSGFGPRRWGKKRSSAAGKDDGVDDERMEERKDDSGDESNGGPVAGDDLDDDDDDEDDDGRIVKKRGRKRVKARSLKSLM